MAQFAMAVLAGSVALGYFTIACVVAPRIRMPSAGHRVVLVIRGAAVAFFVGCGMTHVHILVHTLGYGAALEVETHELVFHSLQAIGAWLFIAGAILRLELHVVPARNRTELKAQVEQQRELAQAATQLASQDELTGLARRWRFDEELERQILHASRYDTPGALLLIDLDGLKRVNDSRGHQAGDRVLRHVADAMRAELRGTDVAARIGGDEFAIILPHTDAEEAGRVAQRLVTAVRGTPADGALTSSVSIGVAAIDGSWSSAEVMEHADLALYEAKRAGGDRHAVSAAAGQPHPV